MGIVSSPVNSRLSLTSALGVVSGHSAMPERKASLRWFQTFPPSPRNEEVRTLSRHSARRYEIDTAATPGPRGKPVRKSARQAVPAFGDDEAGGAQYRLSILALDQIPDCRHRQTCAYPPPIVRVETKTMARLLSVNVGLPRDIEWQGKTVHTAVWKAPVQGRRVARRLNIDGDGQGDLAGHGGEHRAVFVYQIELLPLLAKPARSKRLYLWPVRREFYGRGATGYRSVHRRSLPDRRCPVRSDAAARHLLSGRHPHERAADGGAAGLTRQARLLFPGPGGRRSRRRRRNRQGRGGSRAYDRRRDQCSLILAGSPGKRAGTSVAHSGIERRLENVVGGAARPGTEGRRAYGQPRARPVNGSAPGVARLPPVARIAEAARKQQCHLASPGVCRRRAADGRLGGAVCRFAAQATARRERSPAQLFAVGRAERGSLSHQRQARAARRRRGLHRYAGSGGRCSRDERSARQLYVAGRAMVLSSLSAPASASLRCWPCCTYWPPSSRRERFGGFTVRATAASIRLRPRCAHSSRSCLQAAVTSATVRHSQAIDPLSISTLPDA